MLENGATWEYTAGQPVMETGVANAALISLFTRPGFSGNIFLEPEQRIGSDFENTCRGTITLSRLNDIENAAVRALTSKLFPDVTAAASNPSGDQVRVVVHISPGASLNLNRESGLWKATAKGL
jgi:hypothetical protein